MRDTFGEATCRVPVNDEGGLSLRPSLMDVPGGWRAPFGVAGRADCLAYAEERWTDLRPLVRGR